MKLIERFMIFMGIFILNISYGSFALAILKEMGVNYSTMSTLNKSFILITIDITLMLIFYLIYRKELNRELKKYFHNFKKYFQFGFNFWMIGLAIMLLSNFLIGFFVTDMANNEAAIQETLVKMPIYIAFSSCIFAPFTEEIIFRKCLGKIFKSNILFYIASGLIFGGIHTVSGFGTLQMLYIIPYGTFGVIFAYMYRKTNTIFVPMTFHMIHNTLLTLVSLYSQGVI